MKFTFKSEQYGTVVEMSFEGVTLSEIEEMYKQFLRGSGFYLVEDEDDMSTKQENSDTSAEPVHASDIRKAAEMALESLMAWEEQAPQYWDGFDMKTVEALRQALAQPEQEKTCVSCGKPTMHMGDKCYGCCQTAQPEQEPVVEVQYFGEKQVFVVLKQLSDGDKLYTAPPSKEWVSLTDEQIANAVGSPLDEVYLADFRKVIEKLKERNT